jgi:DNA-binding transcriptional MerR regulator
MNQNQFVRAYSIKEVSKKLNIPNGTIRQWEKDLNGLLTVPRTKEGSRYYTEKEINLLQKVKEMRANNVSKNMIRTLLEKHLETSANDPADMIETMEQIDEEKNETIATNQLIVSQPSPTYEQFTEALMAYRDELIQEVRNEMTLSRMEIVNEIKKDLSSTSLRTVKELSKSIQRANHRRQEEHSDLKNQLLKVSKHTSESFTTLNESITKNSEGAYEQLSKTSKMMAVDHKNMLGKMARTVSDTNKELRKMASLLEEKHELFFESMDDLRQTAEDIQHREDIFQGMLKSFREAAASKGNKKKWWRVW